MSVRIKSAVKVVINLISFIVLLFCLNTHPTGYEFIFLLPLSFLLCFNFLLFPTWKRTGSITIVCIIVTAFIRYVLLACSYSLDPCYNINDFYCKDSTSLSAAILYMCYELLFIACFCFLFFKKRNGYLLCRNQQFIYGLTNNSYCYFYVIFCIAMVLSHPVVFNNIHFLRLATDTGDRVAAQELDTTELIVRQFFQVGLLLMFTILVGHWAEKYQITYKKKYFIASLILALLIVSVIVGEQRAVQIYTAFTAIYFLCRIFPNKKKVVVSSITITVLVVVGLLSIYKTFYAFNSDSYREALSSGISSGFSLSYQFEAYVLGPVSVAASLQLPSTFTPDIWRLLFDFVRSTIGPSFFVKDLGIDTTTVIYNRFVSHGFYSNGFLLPISAQGAIYLTPVLGPLLICLYYRCSFSLERVMKRTSNPYVCVFLGYMFIRFSTCMISTNINTINTMASLTILFVFPLLLVNKVLLRNNN